jgi:hypothetical protein
MKIGWLVPCRYVEVTNSLATIVGAGIDQIAVAELPVPEPLQVTCAMRVVAEHHELDDGQEHLLTCRVYDPQMEVSSEEVIPLEMHGSGEEPVLPALILPMAVTFAPQEEGQHTIEVELDGSRQMVPMIVRLAPEESP